MKGNFVFIEQIWVPQGVILRRICFNTKIFFDSIKISARNSKLISLRNYLNYEMFSYCTITTKHKNFKRLRPLKGFKNSEVKYITFYRNDPTSKERRWKTINVVHPCLEEIKQVLITIYRDYLHIPKIQLINSTKQTTLLDEFKEELNLVSLYED